MLEREFSSRVESLSRIDLPRLPEKQKAKRNPRPLPPSFKGKHHHIESITRIKEGNKGKKRGPKTVEKIRRANIRRWQDPEFVKRMSNQEVPQDRIGKIRLAMRRIWRNKEYRKKVTRQNRFRRQPAIIDPPSLALWQYAQDNGLLPQMVGKGILKKRERERLERFFIKRRGLFPEELIERFSTAVANLS